MKLSSPDVSGMIRLACVQIQADVRTIMSRTFASRHSLRFPRCVRVRWDKSPTDIQTDQDLWEIVESNKGAIVGASPAGLSPPCSLTRCKIVQAAGIAGTRPVLGSCYSPTRLLLQA